VDKISGLDGLKSNKLCEQAKCLGKRRCSMILSGAAMEMHTTAQGNRKERIKPAVIGAVGANGRLKQTLGDASPQTSQGGT